MRQEWNLVGRLDLRGGARHGLLDIADVLCDWAGLERGQIELACNLSGGQPGMRTVLPFDLERFQALLRRSHVGGYHRDGVVEPHDLAHTFHSFGRAVVYALHAPAEHGRLRQCRDLHPRRTGVDAENRGAVDLRR